LQIVKKKSDLTVPGVKFFGKVFPEIHTMRKQTWAIALVLIAIIIVGGWFFYTYLKESRHLPKGLEARQEWQIAVADANRAAVFEPVACFVALPFLAWVLALARFAPLSWFRNILATAVVVLTVFTAFVLWMDRVVKEHDASYILPPGTVLNVFMLAVLGTLGTLVLWFVIERIYVARRIAPNA